VSRCLNIFFLSYKLTKLLIQSIKHKGGNVMVQNIVKGVKAFYGEAIGILLLDVRIPRIPGDIGNATTFNFPVRYKVVKGATAANIVEDVDSKCLSLFIEAGKELEEEGVRAITTSCGFLAMWQDEIAQTLHVPFFSSSLLQIPIVYRMLGSKLRIAVLTANDETLPRHLEKVGVADIPLAVKGAQNEPDFYKVFVKGSQDLDVDRCQQAVVRMATEIIEKYPDVGAFVCEGTNFSSFGQGVQEATGLPFFDIVTMTQWIYAATVKRRKPWGFKEFM
jgi:hypothetical protein